MVLSGSEPAWGSTGAVAMTEVVRAALARIEDDLVHVLVEVGPVAECGVAAAAGRDVAELLAELIGNAVAVCSPVARVRVSGQAVADRYVVEVQDCGVGASSGEADRPHAPLVESVPRRMFALFERMACGHGVNVRLCRSAHGGVNALVLLPRDLLARTTVETTAAAPAAPASSWFRRGRDPGPSGPEPSAAPPGEPRCPMPCHAGTSCVSRSSRTTSRSVRCSASCSPRPG